MSENTDVREEVQEEVSIDSVLAEADTNNDGKIDVAEAATFILKSRTIQLNILGLVAIFVQSKYGFVISSELQTEILLMLNIFIRTRTTKPIKWTK
jgi:hypothetical protein